MSGNEAYKSMTPTQAMPGEGSVTQPCNVRVSTTISMSFSFLTAVVCSNKYTTRLRLPLVAVVLAVNVERGKSPCTWAVCAGTKCVFDHG